MLFIEEERTRWWIRLRSCVASCAQTVLPLRTSFRKSSFATQLKKSEFLGTLLFRLLGKLDFRFELRLVVVDRQRQERRRLVVLEIHETLKRDEQ